MNIIDSWGKYMMTEYFHVNLSQNGASCLNMAAWISRMIPVGEDHRYRQWLTTLNALTNCSLQTEKSQWTKLEQNCALCMTVCTTSSLTICNVQKHWWVSHLLTEENTSWRNFLKNLSERSENILLSALILAFWFPYVQCYERDRYEVVIWHWWRNPKYRKWLSENLCHITISVQINLEIL